MGQGVIRSLKAHYIEWVVQLLCNPLEKGYPNPKMLILQAMKILVTSWVTVAQETVNNCFKKVGITPEAKRAAVADSVHIYKAAVTDMGPEGLYAESIIKVDHDVIITTPCITEDVILEQFQTRQTDYDEGNNDGDIETVNDVGP